MYRKVDIPKKATERWLNRAFAPLNDYLGREHPEEARSIMAYMMFMGNENQRFYYKNSITRDSIVLDQSGKLVFCGTEALRYKFDWPQGVKVERPPREDRFIHPNVTRWMTKNLSRKADEKYGEEVCIFLQELWGPMVNFDFEDLKVGYPVPGARLPYCLYLYPSEFPTLVAIQFVGDEIVEKRCSYSRYRHYEQRERQLIYEGWHVIHIIREFLDRDLDMFKLYMSKAMKLAAPRDTVYVVPDAGRRAMERD